MRPYPASVKIEPMTASIISRVALLRAGALAIALLLSSAFSAPYIFTAIGFSGWLLLGHLVVLDEDFPGGWSNPDGTHPVPWRWLVVKGVVFLALCLAATSPALRQWGG